MNNIVLKLKIIGTVTQDLIEGTTRGMSFTPIAGSNSIV